MLWFLVVVILLVLWLVERNRSKKEGDKGYQNGLADGYQMAKDQVEEVRASKKDDSEVLDLFLAVGDDTETVAPQVEAVQTSTAGILYEEVPLVSNYEQTASQMSQSVYNEPILSPEEVEQNKAERTIKNLNTILYVASFLIVAATALFVTLSMSPVAKLAGLISVTALFYVGGLVLYDKSTRLRSAAIAFVGTGMAILPFIGFALTTLGNMSNEAAWLITSLIGLVAYAVAAMRLQSQLVSYITMAFVLSLALSAVSILSLAVIWYFIVVIGISALFNCLYVLSPKALPKIFVEPIRNTGLFTTPIALAGSLLVIDQMNLWMYTVLFTVATVHYLVVWLIQRTVMYELVVRALAHVALLILTADIVKDMRQEGVAWFGIVWLILAAAQVVYSLVRLRFDGRAEEADREKVSIGVALSLMLVSLLFWPSTELPNHWASVNLALIGLSCGVVAYSLRRVNWLYGALAVSAILPFILGRQVIEPHLSMEVLAGVFAVLGLIGLAVLERAVSGGKSQDLQKLLSFSVLIYAALLALCGLLAGSSLALGWTLALAAGMIIALSYLTEHTELEVAGAVVGVISIAAWVDKLLTNTDWQLTVTVVVSSLALAAGAAVHQQFKQAKRRDYLVAVGVLVFAGLFFAPTGGDKTVTATSLILLLAAGVGALVGRGLLAGKTKYLGTMALLAYIAYPVLAMMLGVFLGGGWLVLATLISTGVVWVSSYLERQPTLTLLGNVLLGLSVTSLWYWLDFSSIWAVYGIAWVSATVYYLMYWYNYGHSDNSRAQLSLISVLASLGVSAMYGLFVWGDQTSLASAGSLLMISGITALYGYMQKQNHILEATVYVVTLGLQWITTVLLPEVNLVVYAHWWAVTIGLVAMWRGSYKTRVIVALSFVTASTGLFALGGESGYSLLFLIEHLILVVVGALIRQQWAMWWGVIAVVIAVLYFLRGYTFLALLFLGFLLILFVVWRLIKIGNKNP